MSSVDAAQGIVHVGPALRKNPRSRKVDKCGRVVQSILPKTLPHLSTCGYQAALLTPGPCRTQFAASYMIGLLLTSEEYV